MGRLSQLLNVDSPRAGTETDELNVLGDVSSLVLRLERDQEDPSSLVLAEIRRYEEIPEEI